jgi:hypothetical protein
MRGGATDLEKIMADERLNGLFMKLVDARKTQFADTNDAQTHEYQDATEIVEESSQKIADLINKNKGEEEQVTSGYVLRLVEEHLKTNKKRSSNEADLDTYEPTKDSPVGVKVHRSVLTQDYDAY